MKINNDNFLLVYSLIHLAVAAPISLLIFLASTDSLLFINFNIGQLFAALFVASSTVLARGILYKKSVALPVGVIVFKYAFIGILILRLSSVGLIHNLYLASGVSILVPCSLILGFIYSRQQQLAN